MAFDEYISMHQKYFLCDGHVFISKLVAMHSGNTYFRCISLIFLPFSLFLAAATEANHPPQGRLGGREEGRRTEPLSGNCRPLNTMITENGLQKLAWAISIRGVLTGHGERAGALYLYD